MIYTQRGLLVYEAYSEALRCHSWSLPGFLLWLVPDCFAPPVGTIILSEGHSSQQRNASPRESHTHLLVLLACGAPSSHTALTGSCRWSSRIRMDGKNKAWRGNTGRAVVKTRDLNFKLWAMETHKTFSHIVIY